MRGKAERAAFAIGSVRHLCRALYHVAQPTRVHWVLVERFGVHAIMRAHGLVLARDREPGEPARGHVVVPDPNRRLATDTTTVWKRRDGVVALVPTIDCGDRTAVVEVTIDQHGTAVLASLEAKLVTAFGAPANVPRASSCAPTTGRSTPAPTARRCARAGIVLLTRTRLSAVPRATPWSSASSARSRKNLSGSATGSAPTSCARRVATWLHHYLHHWPHQALNWQTPIERRAERRAAPVAQPA